MDMEEAVVLRKGYLLVQNVKKKWKVRWFVLGEDQLCGYHKSKSVLISTLPLISCTITSPCNDLQDANLHGLLKLSLPDGEAIYFEAAGSEDRDGWAHAIGAVIRSLSSTVQKSQEQLPFRNFTAYANVSEIIGALQDPDAGIATATHLRAGQVCKDCFKGSEIVDWLLRWSLVRNRENGSAMAQTLLRLGHLQQVCLKDGSVTSPKFADSDTLYRFTSMNLGCKRNSFYDSTDSDSGSSSDDEDDAGEEVKPKKGRFLKQSFLAKKKPLRKGWRVVKVKLQESPKALQYHRAVFASYTDDQMYPCKILPLEGCTITSAVKKSKSKAVVPKPPSHRLCFRTSRGKTLTLQMKDEQEKQEWLALLLNQELSAPAKVNPEPIAPAKLSQEPHTPAKVSHEPSASAQINPEPSAPRKKSQELNTPAKGSQEQDTPAKGSQEQDIAAKESQEQDIAAKGSQEQDTPAKGSQEQDIAAKESQQQDIAAKGSLESNAPTKVDQEINTLEKGGPK